MSRYLSTDNGNSVRLVRKCLKAWINVQAFIVLTKGQTIRRIKKIERMHQINKNKISNFWEEFAELSSQVLLDPENNETISKIDSLVTKLGEYDWEYGPSAKCRFYFCLSPNLNEELLSSTDMIVSMAPDIADWEIISCKPQKTENISDWKMLNESNQEIIVSTENWECVLYKFQDQTYDLDIKISGVNGDEDTKYTAIDIHLTNLLGERSYMKLIKGITIVSEFEKKAIGRSILVKDIQKYIPNA